MPTTTPETSPRGLTPMSSLVSGRPILEATLKPNDRRQAARISSDSTIRGPADEYRDGRLAWKIVAEIRRVTTPQANRALRRLPKRPIRLVCRRGLEPWTR